MLISYKLLFAIINRIINEGNYPTVYMYIAIWLKPNVSSIHSINTAESDNGMDCIFRL